MKPVLVLTAHRGPVTGIQVSDNYLFAGSSDGTVSIHSKPNFTYNHRLFGHVQRGISQIYYFDQCVACAADDCISLSDLNNNCLVKIQISSPAICISMNKLHIVAGFADASTRLYERASGTEIAIFRGHESAVLSVELFNQFIISGGQDGKIVFHNTSGMTLHTIRLKNPVASMKLSPNGGVLCALSLGEVHVFKVDLERIKETKLGRSFKDLESQFLHQVCFFGKKVVFGGVGRILLFDVLNGGKEEISLPKEQQVLCVDADQERIYCGTKQGRVFVVE
uniref:WD domain, G-beta repeat-containing protein n=1 Tax=Trepomonas sp. PC1 TaxID=1076344 RepID=A0A146KDQ8_9EUKA|eukprot:JAP94338.1 WD domain, G-beta repeat-containing protein [Trepomonas sp. PC1]